MAVFFFSCQDSSTSESEGAPTTKEENPTPPAPAQLAYETRVINDTLGCTDSAYLCLTIHIAYPEAIEGPEELQYAVNYYLLATIGDQLKGYLSEKTSKRELLPLVELVKNTFTEMTSDIEEEEHNWQIDIQSTVTFTNDKLLVLETQTEDYTGGAHGNRYIIYGNLSKPGGDELSYSDFVADMDGFKASAEVSFRNAQELAPNADLEAYGYFFEDGVFQLPEQFAFTEDGLLLVYNTYEIGPYSMGIIQFTMPYEQLRDFVKGEYLPQSNT